jgi:hypothetical protein
VQRALNAYSGYPEPEGGALASAYSPRTETYRARFPDGTIVSKELPAGSSDIDVRNAFLQDYKRLGSTTVGAEVRRPKPLTNEDYWRSRLKDQGSITAPHATLGQASDNQPDLARMLAQQIAGALGEHGFDEKHAFRRAHEVTSFLQDFSPLGNIASALFPGSELEQQLAILPIPGAERKAILKGIRAWHGSPHLFERFSLDKIGTGEGAQAYGHGLYFAENPETAKQYRNNLAYGSASDTLAEAANKARWAEVSKLEQAKASGKNPFGGPWDDGWEQRLHANREDATSLGQNPGHLYEVNINADPDSLLDWDRPLSEQPGHVRDMLGGIFPDNATGEHIVRQSGNDARDMAIIRNNLPATTLPGSQAAASRSLLDLGIPGIKYLDQGSRTAGDGTRNFVVFDDGIVDILNRY